jgi:hypothetical protein
MWPGGQRKLVVGLDSAILWAAKDVNLAVRCGKLWLFVNDWRSWGRIR